MVEIALRNDYLWKDIDNSYKKHVVNVEKNLNDNKLYYKSTHNTMDKDPTVVLRNRNDAKRIRKCRVVFSYKQDHEDELSLNVGDVIDIHGEEEEGWWRGKLNGKIGVFPSNFVEEIITERYKDSQEEVTNIVSEVHADQVPWKPVLCEVKYPYKSQNEDELNLKEGDIVTLVSKDGQDPGWWKGQLNGVIGVFPDNFVTILPYNEDKQLKENKKLSKAPSQEHLPLKPISVASQRRSLEVKNDKSETEIKTPPVPGKKPSIPVKKSPSSSATGGLFSGIKKKISDAVDGASASKSISPKTDTPEVYENVFDQVERVSLLPDVRATRPKAPAGRKPPSGLYKEDESGILNGTSDLVSHMDVSIESLNSSTGFTTSEGIEVKAKLREWEKHKAPWLEEMKLNQAKRTHPPETKPKTPEKTEVEEIKVAPIKSEKDSNIVDVSKSVGSGKLKTPPPELEPIVFRNKPSPAAPAKPIQPTQNSTSPVSNDVQQRPQSIGYTKVLPPTSQTPPSPTQKCKNPVEFKPDEETFTCKQYSELLERVEKLELLVEKQNLQHMAAIDELKGKLRHETKMRNTLQEELDKLLSQNVLQV